MMIVLYLFLIIVFILSILVLFAPREFNVSRSVEIDKPLPEVFQYLKLIKNQNEWSPWKKKDPDMIQEFVGTDGKVGFISKWEGNKDVGSGEQEITRVVENETVEAQLRFLKPWKSQSNAFTRVDDLGEEKTRVTWGFSGISKRPTNVFFLFCSMDKAVGKDFEEGLASLKKILEV